MKTFEEYIYEKNLNFNLIKFNGKTIADLINICDNCLGKNILIKDINDKLWIIYLNDDIEKNKNFIDAISKNGIKTKIKIENIKYIIKIDSEIKNYKSPKFLVLPAFNFETGKIDDKIDIFIRNQLK